MRTVFLALGAAALLVACSADELATAPAPPPVLPCPVARVAAGPADLVTGPLARGTAGDLVLENDRLRAVIQKGGRDWGHINQFGGNLIDALPKRGDGSLTGRDHFEEFALGTNIESSPNYQSVTVLSSGGANPDGTCKPAVIRATGPDDLLDFVNGSSAIRGLTLQGAPLNFPPSADDVDLPVMIQTDYSLEDGKNYIKLETRLMNQSSTAQRIYLVEYVNGSGEVELFQHGYGFGEPFATAPCDRCNYMAYAGHEGGSGVSYGLIHREAGSSSVSVSGVSVFLYGRDIVTVATTPEPTQLNSPTAGPNYTVPASGELLFTRFFAVGDGTVASIVDARNEIHGLATGVVEGLVTDAAGPVAGAEIAMLSSARDGFAQGRGPVMNVVNHFRTDAAGRYRGTYPAGTYTLRINMPGRLDGTPASASITLAANQTVSQNFTLPSASGIRVTVKDSTGRGIPAKVLLVGNPQGPDASDPQNTDMIAGQNALNIRTGVFGDALADALPPNISLAEFAVLDSGNGAVTLGDTGVHLVEPGTYQLSVSRGPRYSEFTQDVTVTAGQTLQVTATLTEVIQTPGYVFGDFHVHSFDSPDSEVTNRERVATYVSEDVDFFTPSDHEMRVDFGPVVDAMNLGDWIATAPAAETTTFDYGHFNFWPVGLEFNSPDDELPGQGHSEAPKTARGATDWGGRAPLGKDFPSAGNYSLTPQQISEDAANDPLSPGRQVVRQVNHMYSHFGNSGGSGLGINTGVNPPQSSVAGGARRLDPTISNYYSDSFDSLEVWIGTDGRTGQNAAFLGETAGGNLGDWFNLLNQGRRRTAVSNSDTHERRITSLHTRNVISVPPTLLAAGRASFPALALDPHTVGDSIRAGYTSMTNAPFLTVKAKNAANQTAGLELTDEFGVMPKPLPLATPTEAVNLTLELKSPLWAQYNQILVFVNGTTTRATGGPPLNQPTTPPRYRVCAPPPAQVLNLPTGFARNEVEVAGAGSAKRFETSETLSVSGGGADYWIVVMARGTDGVSVPMWPVVPDSFTDSGGLTTRNTADRGVQALAVSNPIFVDANNDGDWDAPGVLTGSCANGNLPPS